MTTDIYGVPGDKVGISFNPPLLREEADVDASLFFWLPI